MLLLWGLCPGSAQAERLIHVGEGSDWYYFKETSPPPSRWNHIGFDSSKWQRGRAGFGYNSRKLSTEFSEMRGKFKGICVRKDFYIQNPAELEKMTLSLECGGPFVAYINGIEVVRNSVSMSLPAGHDRTVLNKKIDISGFIHELLPGQNVVAVRCENSDISSDEFTFIPIFEVHGN